MSTSREVGGLKIDDVPALQFLKSDSSKDVVATATVDLTSEVSGVLPTANGGSGLSSIGGVNTLLYTSAINVITSLANTPNRVLVTRDDGSLSWTQSIPATSLINNSTSQNKSLNIVYTGAPVNHLEFVTGNTGNSPIIRSVGANTNVDLTLNSKGNGKVVLSSFRHPLVDGDDGDVLATDGNKTLQFVEPFPGRRRTFSLLPGLLASTITIPTTNNSAYALDIKGVGNYQSGLNIFNSITFFIRDSYKNVGGVVTKINTADDILVTKDLAVNYIKGVNMSVVSVPSVNNILILVYGDALVDSLFSISYSLLSL